eukprot:CAMPEP_0184753438 /NCGR_PEP_ID=MMETSP0315-20130426/44102_1 /TAXON_ID=101924 /ORGANISM="Rhodosorus marinus, Strain UTEX LB 2760" /LENGTH=412 /DNA_ID=CAMNT_0027232813 /DNA_START=584 /DNA_END=1822 /DNA_ORIENTATION=+
MLVSTAEKQFVNDAVKSSIRVDGRRLDETRETKFHPLQTSGSIEVSIGMTRALAYVEVEHTLPHPDRPSEGIVNFQVEYSPSANQDRAFEFLMGSASEDPLLTREVERAIRDSRALDTEALCILASKLVWSLKVVITILDHCGNVSDVAQVAAIAALKHARRPDFTISGKEVTIHPVTHREAVPLPINFMPIMTTFALFDSGAVVVIDPSALEEAAMEGKVAVVMNEHKEICGIRKPGGVCIELELLVQMVKMAGARTLKLAKELTRSLKSGPTEMLHESSPTLPDPNLMFNSLGAQQAENCVEEIGAEMKSPGNARDEPPPAPTGTLTDTDNHSNAPHPPPSAGTVQRNDVEMAHEDESETANVGKGFKTSQDSKNLESSDSDDDDSDGDLMAALISRPRGGGGSGRRRPK